MSGSIRGKIECLSDTSGKDHNRQEMFVAPDGVRL
jgi:hypothetical protein